MRSLGSETKVAPVALVWRGCEQAGVVDAGGAAGGVEVEGEGFVADGGEGVGVLPALGGGAADVVGDVVLEEGGFGAGLHGEVVPLAVQAKDVDE